MNMGTPAMGDSGCSQGCGGDVSIMPTDMSTEESQPEGSAAEAAVQELKEAAEEN